MCLTTKHDLQNKHKLKLTLISSKPSAAESSRRQPKTGCAAAAEEIGAPPNQPKMPAATNFSAGRGSPNNLCCEKKQILLPSLLVKEFLQKSVNLAKLWTGV